MSCYQQHTTRIERSFSRSAGTYAYYSAFQRRVARELLAGISSAVSPLLDLGCGTNCCFGSFEGDSSPLFFGLDRSFAMLQHNPMTATPFRRLIQGDCHKLPFQRGSFSRILSNLVWHWCHFEAALKEAWDVLAEGGGLYVSMMGPKSYPELNDAVRSCRQKTTSCVHSFLPPEMIVKILSRLSIDSWRMDHRTFLDDYCDVDTLLREIKHTGTNVTFADVFKGLGARHFLSQIKQIYKDRYTTSSGVAVTREVYFLEIRK